jgi:molecular chaperone GrpE (heat shock protein)
VTFDPTSAALIAQLEGRIAELQAQLHRTQKDCQEAIRRAERAEAEAAQYRKDADRGFVP